MGAHNFQTSMGLTPSEALISGPHKLFLNPDGLPEIVILLF
jgi:hypothetical protein